MSTTMTKPQQELVDRTFTAISRVVRTAKARLESRDFQGAAEAASDARVMLTQFEATMREISAVTERSVA